MSGEDEDATLLAGIPEDELKDFLAWRQRVQGTNISEKTLLATDYLNHFNEIVMLIEMIPDMTMMFEDCQMWQPKSYQEHFRVSGFSDKDLAIEAYDHVPSKFRRPFEDTIHQIDQVVAHTLQKIAPNVAEENIEQLRRDCSTSTEMLHRIIQVANGIIHGYADVMEQNEIDQYLDWSR